MSTSDSSFKEVSLEKALFPVELRPVWVPMERGNLEEISRYQAVVDVNQRHVFSVVANDYKLVHNREAVELGRQCFGAVFQLTSPDAIKPYNIVMPKTRSFCHIDFIHPDASFDFYDEDPWTPFLRVTNSYNRTFALNFDLGFCRGICKNGLIAGKQSIEFKYTHSKSSGRDPKGEFAVRSGEFANLEADFIDSLHNLKRYHVPPEFMWPLLCKVFRVTIPDWETLTPQQEMLWEKKLNAVTALRDDYFAMLGQNGYAALNVMTDYASRPTVEISAEQRINALQTYSGEWVTDFVSQIQHREFDFRDYLGKYAALAA
jgi:hypothetical protein